MSDLISKITKTNVRNYTSDLASVPGTWHKVTVGKAVTAEEAAGSSSSSLLHSRHCYRLIFLAIILEIHCGDTVLSHNELHGERVTEVSNRRRRDTIWCINQVSVCLCSMVEAITWSCICSKLSGSILNLLSFPHERTFCSGTVLLVMLIGCRCLISTALDWYELLSDVITMRRESSSLGRWFKHRFSHSVKSMSGPSHAPIDDSPPDSGSRRQKPHVSVILEERMLQDPILARHFQNLENPGSPELIQNPFDTLASPHQLRTSHRLVRSTDSSGIKYKLHQNPSL